MAFTIATYSWKSSSTGSHSVEIKCTANESDIIYNQDQIYWDYVNTNIHYTIYNSCATLRTDGNNRTFRIFIISKTPCAIEKYNNGVLESSVSINTSFTYNGETYYRASNSDVNVTYIASTNDKVLLYCFTQNLKAQGTYQEDFNYVSNIPIFYYTTTPDWNEAADYMSNPFITFQWASVPAISGKNGILSLPVLIDTDGNPVSNGSASDFSTLPDSVKVRTLADLAVQ